MFANLFSLIFPPLFSHQYSTGGSKADEEQAKLCAKYRARPETDSEIVALFEDLKVLNKKDYKSLLRWRDRMRDADEAEKRVKYVMIFFYYYPCAAFDGQELYICILLPFLSNESFIIYLSLSLSISFFPNHFFSEPSSDENDTDTDTDDSLASTDSSGAILDKELATAREEELRIAKRRRRALRKKKAKIQVGGTRICHMNMLKHFSHY